MTTLDTITTRGQTYSLLPVPFWHVAHPTAGFLFHNVTLYEGLCWSISVYNRSGLEGAVSPYALRVMSDEKEQVWERVRLAVSPKLPSRKGAIFLVEGLELAEKIATDWFGEERRHILEARVVAGSKLHRADSKWLDGLRDQWAEKAGKYWRGEMTEAPVPEILVDGGVYFPGWKSPPFGLFAGVPRPDPSSSATK